MRVEDCVIRNEMRPIAGAPDYWNSIITTEEVKDRLFRSAVLALRIRQAGLPFETTALHGLVLLYGPPGTGKTTLARGLADELAAVVGGRARFIEVDPHGLMSSEHGHSQQAVMELLTIHVPGLADDGTPTVLLLDEVEAMAVARSAASLEANPADVHRATDAVLTALDQLASTCHHVVTVATSNFTATLDSAFRSRTDDAIEIALPDATAISTILQSTLTAFAASFPGLADLAEDPKLRRVANSLVGLDGRQVRKLVTDAMKQRKETVLDPGCLTMTDLTSAARSRCQRSIGAEA